MLITTHPASVHAEGDPMSPLVSCARALLERESEVLGTYHLEGSRVVSRLTRDATTLVPLADIQRYARVMLAAGLLNDGSRAQGRTMCVIGTRDLWLFGMQSANHGRESAWLITRRSLPQGFGWAALTALFGESAPSVKD